MTAIAEAAARLVAGLKTVEGLRHVELAAAVDRPSFVVGMPRLSFEAYDPGTATSATFPVFLVVPLDDRAQKRLWDYVEPVAAALEGLSAVTVGTAEPGMYESGSVPLPSYTFTVEMSL